MRMFPSILQVLDKAERLRDMEANILPAFLRLQELVCTVLPISPDCIDLKILSIILHILVFYLEQTQFALGSSKHEKVQS